MSNLHSSLPGSVWARPSTAVMAVFGVAAVLFGLTQSGYYLHVGVITSLSIVLAVTLRPLLVAGEASFCHGSFYALGAYTVATLATEYGWNVWQALPAAGLVAALASLIIGIPSLRTTGSYFFLMTFGFLIVVTSLLQYFKGLTGGFSGIVGIPQPDGVSTVDDFYFVCLAFGLLVVVVFTALDRSRWGLELRAIGDAADLAAAAGVATFRRKLSAFVLGAFVAGVAGGLFASYMAFIAPATFSMWLSIYVLTYVILGGRRYVSGAVVGTLILGALPVAVRWSDAYVGIVVAAVTLGILMVLPRGVVTSVIERFGAGSAARRNNVSDELPASADLPPLTSLPATNGPVLTVTGVSQDFGGVKALTDVEFTVVAGEILGIIGPNGAGKTTLFNVLSGFRTPTSGEVVLSGRSLSGIPPHKRVAAGLTRTFQGAAAFDSLSVVENVVVGIRSERRSALSTAFQPIAASTADLAQARALTHLVGLGQWDNTPAGSLPYGARRRLGVAIALATNPNVLCLDEPLAGLSDTEVADMLSALEAVRARFPITVILIEHRINVMLEICDRFLALDFGRVIALGDPAEVAANPAVVEAYVGQGKAASGHGE
ncbi:ATP-binding cassette domain-containing protein [Streptomyces sp. NPDC085460]|uniref:branched-chain amino acid ABC transporter ATP-binding protein/permease n=1 Tax=Streptomyces sp. NPDC085460 TaxID=3365723 RepID=UPI0037CF16B5